jgi:hypothetical protein
MSNIKEIWNNNVTTMYDALSERIYESVEDDAWYNVRFAIDATVSDTIWSNVENSIASAIYEYEY